MWICKRKICKFVILGQVDNQAFIEIKVKVSRSIKVVEARIILRVDNIKIQWNT